jgi:hypothetical protein
MARLFQAQRWLAASRLSQKAQTLALQDGDPEASPGSSRRRADLAPLRRIGFHLERLPVRAKSAFGAPTSALPQHTQIVCRGSTLHFLTDDYWYQLSIRDVPARSCAIH